MRYVSYLIMILSLSACALDINLEDLAGVAQQTPKAPEPEVQDPFFKNYSSTSEVADINKDGRGSFTFVAEKISTSSGEVYVGSHSLGGSGVYFLDNETQKVTRLNSYSRYARLGNKIYSVTSNEEVYEYNMATNENRLIKKLNAPYVFGWKALDGKIYFDTDGGDGSGRELWAYDPSDHSETRITEIHPTGDARPSEITVLGDALYFYADDGVSGRELWKYIPSTDTASLVYDANSGPGSSQGSVLWIKSYDNKIFFTPDATTTGLELWVYDPVTDSAHVTVDTAPGTADGWPWVVSETPDKIYFYSARGGGYKLFVYDHAAESGSELTALTTAGITVYQDAGYLTVNNDIYLVGDDATNGTALWKIKTSDNSLHLVTTLAAHPTSNIGWGQQMTKPADNVIEMTYYDFTWSQKQWVYDLSDNQFVEADDVSSVTRQEYESTNMSLSGSISNLTSMGGKLYFTAIGDEAGNELWVYEPEEDDARRLSDINENGNANISSMIAGSNGKLYFEAEDGVTGSELWMYDPSSESVIQIADIRSGNASSGPQEFYEFNGKIYFNADDGNVGRELWAIDLSDDNVSLVKDLMSGSGWPRYFAKLDGKLYFAARDDVNTQTQLWVYDPATETVSVTQAYATIGSKITYIAAAAGKLYFSACDNGSCAKTEFYSYDPATNAITKTKDINPFNRSEPRYLTVLNDKVYFRARYGPLSSSTYRLWEYDPSTDALKEISGIHSGDNPYPDNLVVHNDVLYFTARNETNKYFVWSYNPARDELKIETDTKSNLSSFGSLMPFNETIYFRARDGDVGQELFRLKSN